MVNRSTTNTSEVLNDVTMQVGTGLNEFSATTSTTASTSASPSAHPLTSAPPSAPSASTEVSISIQSINSGWTRYTGPNGEYFYLKKGESSYFCKNAPIPTSEPLPLPSNGVNGPGEIGKTFIRLPSPSDIPSDLKQDGSKKLITVTIPEPRQLPVKTALNSTVNPARMTIAKMKEHCLEFDIQPIPGGNTGERATWVEPIQKYWRKRHEEENTEYIRSHCFKPKAQKIERKRKQIKQYEPKKKAKTGKEKKKYHVKPKLAVNQFPNSGLEEKKVNGKMKLVCIPCGVELSGDLSHVGAHIKTKKHTSNLKRLKQSQQVNISIAHLIGKKNQKCGNNETRKKIVTGEDKRIRMRLTRAALKLGFPLYSMFGHGIQKNDMRIILEEEIHCTLTSDCHISEECIPLIENSELSAVRTFCSRFFKGRYSLIWDATPRQGDVFAVIARGIVEGSVDEFMRLQSSSSSTSSSSSSTLSSSSRSKVQVVQVLIGVEFLAKSMTGDEIYGTLGSIIGASSHNGELTRGMDLDWADCIGHMADGCSANIYAFNLLEKNNQKSFLSKCAAHCSYNGCKQVEFVTIALMWKHIQAAFAHSDNTKAVWKNHIGDTWKKFAPHRWFSQFSVLCTIKDNLGKLPSLVSECVLKGYAKESTPKLLKLLNDEGSMIYLKIELSALIAVGKIFADFCYGNEGDGEEIFFVGEDLQSIFDTFPKNKVNWLKLKETAAMFGDAIAWAKKQPETETLRLARLSRHETEDKRNQIRVGAATITNEIVSRNRPQRRAALANEAVRVNESVEDKKKRLKAEADAKVEEALLQARIEQEIEEKLYLEKKALLNAPPLNRTQWKKYVEDGLNPFIEYFLSRFKSGGDRYELRQLMEAARLFDPMYARTITKQKANALIDRLTVVPYLEQRPCLLNKLKAEWKSFYDESKCVQKPASSKINILQWHYDFKSARPNFWEVASVVALIQPTSAAAERVFSQLSSLWGKRQARALADAIRASLLLAVNKRPC